MDGAVGGETVVENLQEVNTGVLPFVGGPGLGKQEVGGVIDGRQGEGESGGEQLEEASRVLRLHGALDPEICPRQHPEPPWARGDHSTPDTDTSGRVSKSEETELNLRP